MQRRFAIILGGGRSTRMGRDKRSLVLGGRSLLALGVDACAGRDLIVAVTPQVPGDVDRARLAVALEDPPFGGPVAGIAAGLAALPAARPGDEVLLLACDLARVGEVVATLDAAPLGPDGVCLVDAEDFSQYLAARYRRLTLAAAIEAVDPRGCSVFRTLRRLDLHRIPAPAITADLDTPSDAAAAGIVLDPGDDA